MKQLWPEMILCRRLQIFMELRSILIMRCTFWTGATKTTTLKPKKDVSIVVTKSTMDKKLKIRIVQINCLGSTRFSRSIPIWTCATDNVSVAMTKLRCWLWIRVSPLKRSNSEVPATKIAESKTMRRDWISWRLIKMGLFPMWALILLLTLLSIRCPNSAKT